MSTQLSEEQLDLWFMSRLAEESIDELYAMSVGADDWTSAVDAEKVRREELDR